MRALQSAKAKACSLPMSALEPNSGGWPDCHSCQPKLAAATTTNAARPIFIAFAAMHPPDVVVIGFPLHRPKYRTTRQSDWLGCPCELRQVSQETSLMSAQHRTH